MTATIEELGVRLARRYRNDPIAFAREILQVRVWSRLGDLLRAIRDNDSVAIRAGQKVSKTTALAIVALWWAVTRPRAKVIFCAPSGLQAQDQLYAEIVRLHAGGKSQEQREQDGGAVVELGGQAMASCEDGVRWADGRVIFGFAASDAKKTEKYLGHSSPSLMVIADEAPGIEAKILSALDGNRAGGGKMILAGNPTRNDGYFFDAFHKSAAFWKGLHIPSSQSPNVTGEDEIPGLARPAYIEQRAQDWGRASWEFQVKIEGNFAQQSERAFIGLELVLEAQKRWTETPSASDLAQPLSIGVDPARMGKDHTSICFRRGGWVDRIRTLAQHDNGEVAGIILTEIERRARPGEYVRVKVDQTNNNGVVDFLKRCEPRNGISIGLVEITSQSGSLDPGFRDMRSHVWGVMKGWLASGAIPAAGDLQAQLTAVQSNFDERLRVRLESKRDVVARLGRSPDDADALALACFEAAPDTALVEGAARMRPMIFNLSSR